MGSLLAALDAAVDSKKRRVCLFGEILESLKSKDRAELTEVLGNRRYPSRVIASVVSSAAGQKVSDTTIEKHRKRTCPCFRGDS